MFSLEEAAHIARSMTGQMKAKAGKIDKNLHIGILQARKTIF